MRRQAARGATGDPLNDLIINAAVTGMVPTREQNPAVPITPKQVVADARRCFEAGASVIHVHARAGNGTPDYRKEIYAEIIGGIHAACPGMLISGSTSGRVFHELSQRSEVLDPGPGCRPDFGSLTLGSLNFPKQASVNAPDMIHSLAGAMNELGIVPELEIFDMGMADYAHFLLRKQILRLPLYGNILLGSLGTLSATPFNLASIVRALPDKMTWSATGIGRYQFFVQSLAVTMGGHVRVGLEDNLWYDAERTRPATNAGLIERIVKLARAAGREIADPAEARRIIGMHED
ncbi:MAG: 3-keto-5-aminohexanoate cleavage protein [Planctomycetota bacterium]|nr:3-keto-5-aminohexanoate cleavage protein [Planctomycetota bacterium]